MGDVIESPQTDGIYLYIGCNQPPPPAPPGVCEETCNYPSDDLCDDGGAGAEYSHCAVGTDCADCGPRFRFPPSPNAERDHMTPPGSRPRGLTSPETLFRPITAPGFGLHHSPSREKGLVQVEPSF